MDREPPSDPLPHFGSAAPRVKPLEWAQATGRSESVARAVDAFVRRRRKQRLAVATGALAILLTGIFWRERSRSEEPSLPAATTIVMAPARQQLSDGTLVDLNEGAAIAVEFAPAGNGPRRVVLKTGEAHFSVTPDANRPFIVEAGGVAVRAIGTAFAVQWRGGDVEVLVTEGTVAVDKASASAGPTATPSSPLAVVDAGRRAVVTRDLPAPEVEDVTVAQLNERLAWRVPRLEFNATPLVDVVALFNRYAASAAGNARPKLTLADPTLESLPLSGVLRADNLPVLLQIMATSYGITAEHRPSGEILLRRG